MLSGLIKSIFQIDERNSSDKKEKLKVNEFGYISRHFVVKIPDRAAFGLKIEIQIRTILQHAWAENHHKLDYKSEFEIPNDIKRDFAKMASLIEIADDLLTRINSRVEGYRKKVSNEKFSRDSTFSIDKDSLYSFAIESKLLLAFDKQIAEMRKATLSEKPFIPFIGRMATQLYYISIGTLGELIAVIENEGPKIIEFAQKFNTLLPIKYTLRESYRGGFLMYVCYYKLASRPSEFILKYLDDNRIDTSDRRQRLIEVFRQIVEPNPPAA